MSRNSYLIIIGCIFLASCAIFRTGPRTNKKYTTESGLQYIIKEKGNGEKPSAGQSVRVHYTGRLTNDTVFDSSRERGQPIVFKLGKGRVIKGWEEGLQLISEGAKARFIIPPELGYGEKQWGSIPAGSTLIFDIELLEVIDPPKPYDVAGHDTIHLESGLKYIKIKRTDNQEAEAFKTVVVDYTGFLTNGEIFDSSIERGFPLEFQLGVGKVIPGLDKGIARLKEGEKARFIIPADLAYGKRGFPPAIPPNSQLIFDVELLEVR